jgi:hypothetical protein
VTLEQQLGRVFADKAKARKYFRLLADLISFDDLGDCEVPTLGRKDLCDPHIAREVARITLLNYGIPKKRSSFHESTFSRWTASNLRSRRTSISIVCEGSYPTLTEQHAKREMAAGMYNGSHDIQPLW